MLAALQDGTVLTKKPLTIMLVQGLCAVCMPSQSCQCRRSSICRHVTEQETVCCESWLTCVALHPHLETRRLMTQPAQNVDLCGMLRKPKAITHPVFIAWRTHGRAAMRPQILASLS